MAYCLSCVCKLVAQTLEAIRPVPGLQYPDDLDSRTQSLLCDVREAALLYFAYTALISPDRMSEAAPNASFEFIAHLADFGLTFPIEGNGWGGALPTATEESGSTVWGAVYSVGAGDRAALDAVEASEGRAPTTLEAIDRMGKRHVVVTHVADAVDSLHGAPSVDYLSLMLDGSKHWGLPAGWLVVLGEHVDPDA